MANARVAQEQWVSRVNNFSTQYNSSGWGAASVIGEPQVYPNFGDLQGAWAQADCSANEFIELEFPRKMLVTELHIYETLNPGAITNVKLRDSEGQWHSVYESQATILEQSRIFEPQFLPRDFATAHVRLELDCSVANAWCEIDAVKMCGDFVDEEVEPEVEENKMADESKMAAAQSRDDGGEVMVELWANKVLGFSSEYAGWNASEILGEPKIYPEYGEISASNWKLGAWAHQAYNSPKEYIEVEFAHELVVHEICVYEVLSAGGVTKIQIRSPGGRWCTVYEGQPEVVRLAREFKPTLQFKSFETKAVRLELDCSNAGWREIDAVKIRGYGNDVLGTETNAPDLATQLGLVVNDANFSDVTLCVDDGKTFHAHRVILAARCEYFRALLDTRVQEQRLEIPNLSGEALLGVLKYLYTNNIDAEITDSALIEIIRAGDGFSLEHLSRLCVRQLQERMTPENVVAMYLEATQKQPVLEYLRKRCIYYISAHLKSVSQSPAFAELPKDIMLLLLQGSIANLDLE